MYYKFNLLNHLAVFAAMWAKLICSSSPGVGVRVYQKEKWYLLSVIFLFRIHRYAQCGERAAPRWCLLLFFRSDKKNIFLIGKKLIDIFYGQHFFDKFDDIVAVVLGHWIILTIFYLVSHKV